MSNCPTTEWCQDSFTMLKHRPTDRAHTCIPPDAFSNWTHQTAQQGTESNGYRGMGPGERVRSVNEHLSHHRVVSGQLHNAQNTGQPTAHTRAYHQMRSRIGRTQTAQQGTESNGYRGMGPGERVRSVNEQLSHHRVVSGQLHNAQTPANRPRTHVHTTRCVLELDAPDGSAGHRE